MFSACLVLLKAFSEKIFTGLFLEQFICYTLMVIQGGRRKRQSAVALKRRWSAKPRIQERRTAGLPSLRKEGSPVFVYQGG